MSSRDTLSRILRVGHDLLDITSRTLPPGHPEYPPRPLSSFTLPDPPPLLPQLLALGTSRTLAQKVDDAYRTRANQLRGRSEVAIAKALCKLSQFPSSSSSESRIVEVLTSAYITKLQLWISDAAAAVKSCGLGATATAANATDRQSRRGGVFNHEYVPLLEHFFDENPFPSHADKVFLAKKSNMTYKQIHVWFQNRRNRTRKSGKTLRKISMSQGATLPMDGLCVRMKKYIRHHQEPKEKHVDGAATTNVRGVFPLPITSDILNCSAPPHAFPGPYPPTCSYDPFLVKSDRCYFVTEWPRRPSSLINQRTPASIDDLVGLFSLLHVRDDGGKVVQNGTSRPDLCAATSAITVRPSVAPHPAQLPNTVISKPPVVPWPIVRAPPSQTRAFGKFGHTSPVGFILPISSDQHERKIIPLPKRLPRCSRFDEYRGFPVTPSGSLSSSPYSYSPSRSSSCGSSSFGEMTPSPSPPALILSAL